MPSRSRRSRLRPCSSWSGSAVAGCGGGTEPRIPTTAALSASTLSARRDRADRPAHRHDHRPERQRDQLPGTWPGPPRTPPWPRSAHRAWSRRRATARPWSRSLPGPSPRTLTSTVAQVPTQLQKVAGDGQTATPGQPVAVPLTVQVNDGSGNPVANVAVTFAAAGGTLGTPNASTGADGRASTAIRTGRDGSAAGDRLGREHVAHGQFHGDRRVAVHDRAPVPHDPHPGPDAGVHGGTAAVGEPHRRRTAERLARRASRQCGTNSPAIQRVVDDLLILVTLTSIDGAGNVLAPSGPCFTRTTGSLPVMGLMQLDTDDLDQLQTRRLAAAGDPARDGTRARLSAPSGPISNLLADASPPPAAPIRTSRRAGHGRVQRGGRRILRGEPQGAGGEHGRGRAPPTLTGASRCSATSS